MVEERSLKQLLFLVCLRRNVIQRITQTQAFQTIKLTFHYISWHDQPLGTSRIITQNGTEIELGLIDSFWTAAQSEVRKVQYQKLLIFDWADSAHKTTRLTIDIQ